MEAKIEGYGYREVRMKEFRALFSGAALVLMTGSLAFAGTPELFLQSGASTVTCAVTGGGCIVLGSSAQYTDANFAGWNIHLAFGESSSPSIVPFGLDLTSLTAACVGGGTCADLQIWLSATDFTTPSLGFTNTSSVTSAVGAASTTQYAWDDPGNRIFGSKAGTGVGPIVAPLVNDGAHFIGSVGPLTTGGSGVSVVGGGPELGTGAHLYSLTIEDVFKGCTGANCVFYSADGAITGVPEPGAVVLFGTVVALCASKLRRRRAS